MSRKSRIGEINQRLGRPGTDGDTGISSRRIAQLGESGEPPRRGTPPPGPPGVRPAARGSALQPEEFVAIKKRLQTDLQADFDFGRHGGKSADELAAVMTTQLGHLADRMPMGLSRQDRDKMFPMIIDNLLGLGPLEAIITDPNITDIMINGPHNCYIERGGLLKPIPLDFDDDAHLLNVIRRIIGAVGRKVDEQSPMVDARMADGSRFNAIIPPCSLDGCAVSIRRFGTPITPDQLILWEAMPRQAMEFLAACVKGKMNTVISGGTGSGKTTLLNCLSGFIPDGERIITIEDSAELQLQQGHVVRLESRPPNSEGIGQVTQGDLLVHSLRMRADRIVLGEIRGAEAVDMLQAMNSGNPGSMATVHSNSPNDALSRFETLVGMGMPNMSDKFIRTLIASALDIIVQLNRLPDGSRRCTAIAEVTGMEGPYVTIQEIFQFRQEDMREGVIYGRYRPTGRKPRCLTRFKQIGIEVKEDEWFDWELEVTGKKR